MQIYTKILIGMGVGVVVGMTLGPTSSLLEKDMYKVSDVSKSSLRLDAEDESTMLPMPSGVALDLHVLETRTEVVKDLKGVEHTLPSLVHVRFDYSQRLSLRDKSGELARALGDPEPGESVKAWLPIKHIALKEGDFVVAPEPISHLGDRVVTWIRPVGKLFMKLIKMVIVPLVFASLVVGVASLGDIRKLGRLGGKTLGLYMCTTAMAVTIGVGLAHLVKPGDFVSDADKAKLMAQFESGADARRDKAAAAPSAIDNVLNIVPENPVASLADPKGGKMLQIIFFAVIFGIALTLLESKDESQIIVTFLNGVQNAMIVVIHMVMATAPFGVAALIADVVGTSGLSVMQALVVYGLTVILGLAILATVVYGGLVRVLARLGWVDFMRAVRPAQLIAFSTSSSSATLPVTLECAEDNLGISKPVSSFVIPLGSTVNMDGTALYQGVAAIFIAQVFNVDLTLGAEFGIILAATVASIGAAGVPGAGMITLAMVLTAAGIPAVGVALILGVDRLLDMFRTTVNVTGDLAVTAVMAVSEGETLQVLSSVEDANDPERGFEHRLDRPQHAVNIDATGAEKAENDD